MVFDFGLMGFMMVFNFCYGDGFDFGFLLMGWLGFVME